MAHRPPSQITQLLQRWRDGNREALDALLPLVYDELRRLAHRHLRNERAEHTLQSSALVHEAYLRLVGQDFPQWEGRTHFFAIAAQLMRQILVDYARRHRASKRGSGVCMLTLGDVETLPQRKDVDVVALNDALNSLAEIDLRQSHVVELRFFAGLSLEDAEELIEADHHALVEWANRTETTTLAVRLILGWLSPFLVAQLLEPDDDR